MKNRFLATALVCSSCAIASTALARPFAEQHPYDYMLHGTFGTALGYVAAREIHPWAGLGFSVLAGVGKEMLDRNYDPRDAFSTILGGLVGTALSGPLNPDPKHGAVIITPVGVVYLLRFE